jgi:hypothetical protein
MSASSLFKKKTYSLKDQVENIQVENVFLFSWNASRGEDGRCFPTA